MPFALIINPNTSKAMSAGIETTARRVFQSPWTCRTENPPVGPEFLESWRDYQLAGAASLPLVHRYPEADGIVLACFGDPGLYAMKEVAKVPVVGIAEAAMSLALMLGGRFGILAAMDRAVGLMDSMVRTYGLEARYAGTVPLDMRVSELEVDHQATLAMLERTCRTLADKGADVVLLGCAGLTDFSEELHQRLSMAIVDPVEAGCRMLKAVVESGLNTSHQGLLYRRPAPQRMNLIDLEAGGLSDYWKFMEDPAH